MSDDNLEVAIATLASSILMKSRYDVTDDRIKQIVRFSKDIIFETHQEKLQKFSDEIYCGDIVTIKVDNYSQPRRFYIQRKEDKDKSIITGDGIKETNIEITSAYSPFGLNLLGKRIGDSFDSQISPDEKIMHRITILGIRKTIESVKICSDELRAESYYIEKHAEKSL